MSQNESVKATYATFLKVQKKDSKNMMWFLKQLKAYKSIYRTYVQSLRRLLLRMRRAPLLSETVANSENNIYESVLKNVNMAEEYTRRIETDFAVVQSAIKDYLKKMSYLKKVYNKILSNEKANMKADGSNKEEIAARISSTFIQWERDAQKTFEFRMKIYMKICVMRLGFEMDGVVPAMQQGAPGADDITVAIRHLDGLPASGDDVVLGGVAKRQLGHQTDFDETCMFPQLVENNEPNDTKQRTFPSDVLPVHMSTGVVCPHAPIEESPNFVPTLLEADSRLLASMQQEASP